MAGNSFYLWMWSAALLACLTLVSACKGKGGGSSSGGSEAPTENKSNGGGDPAPSTAGALQLAISMESHSFTSGLGAQYSVSNAGNLPSVEDAYNRSLPDGMITGSLSIDMGGNNLWGGFQLTSNSGVCVPLPPSANLRGLSTIAKQIILGECRNAVTRATASDADCHNLITTVDGKAQWVNEANVTSTYQNGLWDRFFDGCGPTDIRNALSEVDGVFDDIERQMQNGQFRCVDIPSLHKPFFAVISGAAFSDGMGARDYPLACKTTVNGNVRAFGKDANHFYYWDTAQNGSAIKVSLDGTKLDMLKSIGDGSNPNSTNVPSQSVGIYRVLAEEAPNGDRSFYMTLLGSGFGPDCGGVIATKKSASMDLMYFNVRNPAPGSAPTDWATWSSRCVSGDPTYVYEFCLNGDFSVATAGACAAAGITTLPAGFDEFIYDDVVAGSSSSYVTPSRAAHFNRIPFNNSGVSLSNLVDTASIKDPLKVMFDRVFAQNVGDDANVSKIVEKANQHVQGFLQKQRQANPQCIYERPKRFVHVDPWVAEQDTELLLSCSLQDSFAGLSGDTAYVYDLSQAGERWSVRANSTGLDLWRYASSPGASGSAWPTTRAAGYTRISVKNIPDGGTSQEVMLLGDKERFREMGCGVQYQRQGDKIFVRGKFAHENCDSAYLDEDCLELEANGALKRLSQSECKEQNNGEPFAVPFVLRENVLLSDVLALATRPGPSGPIMSIDSPRAADGAAPATQPTEDVAKEAKGTSLALAPVANLPLTAKTKLFKKVSTDASSFGINCLFAGVGAHTKNVSGKYSFDFGQMSPAELESFNKGIASGQSYVAIEVNRSEVKVVGTGAMPAVSGEIQAVLLEGTNELRKVISKPHETTGAHMLVGFDGMKLGSSHKLEVSWTGKVSVECPTAANSQAMATFNFQGAPKVRFN